MIAGEPITSLQNPRVKRVVRLGTRRHRDHLQQTVVEGVREASLALESGVVPLEAFICPAFLDEPEGSAIAESLDRLAAAGQTRLFEVSPDVYQKMAYRGGSGGILLVIPYQSQILAELPLGERPLLIVVDGAEKPGNLGAILRTADAAGVDAMLLTGSDSGGADMHNPNAIRASLGASFTVPVVQVTRDQAVDWLRQNQIMTVAADPGGDLSYTAVPLGGAVALILGSEAFGLSPDWLEVVDHKVRIPMSGEVNSLNLSVAAAVMLYEARRQRTARGAGSAPAGNGA